MSGGSSQSCQDLFYNFLEWNQFSFPLVVGLDPALVILCLRFGLSGVLTEYLRSHYVSYSDGEEHP
jgi:hypothetical protein